MSIVSARCALKIRLAAPPVDGRANDELCAVLAKALGLRTRAVSVLSGHTSRSKSLLVTLPADEVEQRLLPWIGRNDLPGG